MRKPYIDTDGYSGCCAIRVCSSFEVLYTDNNEIDTKALTDEEWLHLLARDGLWPIITFAHSSKANKGVLTPAKLAKWLRKKGETVTATRPTINPSSISKITAYFWVPSKKFNKKLDNYKKKLDAEDNRDSY